jgi:hypothetical protein
MHAKDTDQPPTAAPHAAAHRARRALGRLYLTYAPECWAALALAAAVVVSAAAQGRRNPARLEPPRPVHVGGHARQ